MCGGTFPNGCEVRVLQASLDAIFASRLDPEYWTLLGAHDPLSPWNVAGTYLSTVLWPPAVNFDVSGCSMLDQRPE